VITSGEKSYSKINENNESREKPKNLSWPTLMFYSIISLEIIRKTTKRLDTLTGFCRADRTECIDTIYIHMQEQYQIE
jgi:hypothetical protein